VAERKDVLAGLLGFAAIYAYVRYARRREKGWYAATLALFALSLLSKAMFITMPAILLLMDVWPMRRLRSADDAQTQGDFTRRTWVGLVREKVPVFVLAIA